MASSGTTCAHNTLRMQPSPHAQEVGFAPLSATKLAAAAAPSGRAPGSSKDDAIAVDDADPIANLPACLPAPLVLPGDELAWDPGCKGQSLSSWIRLKERNAVTQRRKTVYVASTPVVEDDVSIVSRWAAPVGKSTRQVPKLLDPEHVVEYLAAFYHGLPVKPYPDTFRFLSWDGKAATRAPSFLGLAVGGSCTRVRARPCPDGKFTRQLNLNDILDAVIENIPADAYAVLLLVDHDLYEDEDDDFCCGRAYGGSRVAVVSSARYRPELDGHWDIDLEHMWPASHCESFINELCGHESSKLGSKSPLPSSDEARLKPLRAAVEAAGKAAGHAEDIYGLWLSRFVRTASHELGHCFGMGHCVYYACVMQGTAGMAEDVRQPPYLCQVCLKKVTRAVLDVNRSVNEDQYLVQRDMALFKYCDKWAKAAMFAGYRAWLDCLRMPVC